MALRYKSFNQLMASVESDLDTYADESLIDRSKYIKEVRKVNAELGLKLNQEKEDVIDVKDYKAELPADFMYLQLALACQVNFVTVPKIRGIQTEVHTVENDEDIPIEVKKAGSVCYTECDGATWVTQKVGSRTHKFTKFEKLSLSKSSETFCSDDCMNFRFSAGNQMNILNDDEATFSFREGKIYLNYLADMVNENGEVILLDHPLVNDYYEYQVKKKIFENLKLNKIGDFLQDYEIMKGELREAKIRAINIVNTPEFGELVEIQRQNRKRFYNRYIRYFDNGSQGFYNF